MTSTATVEINVEAVADAANVTVGNASGLEDQAIKLDLAASLSDIDGSETMQVAIKGLPEGFALSAGTRNADGSWSVDQLDLNNVSINAPKNFIGQVNLTLEATTTEGSNGSVAVVSKDFSIDIADVNDLPFDIILWALRGAALVATIASGMPALRNLDPANLLAEYRNKKSNVDEQDELESLVDSTDQRRE